MFNVYKTIIRYTITTIRRSIFYKLYLNQHTPSALKSLKGNKKISQIGSQEQIMVQVRTNCVQLGWYLVTPVAVWIVSGTRGDKTNV